MTRPGPGIMIRRNSIPTLEVLTRREWRRWLAAHHASDSEIWLVLYKRHTGVKSLTYNDAVEEALCYGWIDSILRRLDDARYVQKFTPRKVDSSWSTANRRRYADLKSRGLLAAPGLERAPTSRSGDAPRPSIAKLPPYIERALRANPRASHRRAYVGWIDSAKREETKERRLREAVRLLAAGKPLGMK
jgi:uncharacterized protein YdeI (YjbR/CyaY-like superfamily)